MTERLTPEEVQAELDEEWQSYLDDAHDYQERYVPDSHDQSGIRADQFACRLESAIYKIAASRIRERALKEFIGILGDTFDRLTFDERGLTRFTKVWIDSAKDRIAALLAEAEKEEK